MTELVGELGLSVDVAGTVVQALAAQAVDRGNITREKAIAYLSGPTFDETPLWGTLGGLIDQIESAVLGITATCQCGHRGDAHQSGSGPWTGFCGGTLSSMEDGDTVAALVAKGADPNEPCECEGFVLSD